EGAVAAAGGPRGRSGVPEGRGGGRRPPQGGRAPPPPRARERHRRREGREDPARGPRPAARAARHARGRGLSAARDHRAARLTAAAIRRRDMIAHPAVRWLPCAALALLALAAGAGLVRELTWIPPLRPAARGLSEPMPGPGRRPGRVPARHHLSGAVETAQYAIIAVRNLFSASRAEQADAEATVATGPKPYLHGVVLDGD